ncbi:hypothetical protein C8Q70DRAFT_139973 [Cubamyces menziesii]|nr:hypothetical protein C8Q70DRAFT_139973 [Cubamyces menziesii]
MRSLALLWLIWAVLLQVVHAQISNNGTNLICTPFGTCEPCPDDSLHEPFCQPYGNRRLVHCVPTSIPTPTSTWTHAFTSPPSGTLPSVSPTPQTTQGETLGWESCGRIVETERADFYEFFACNLFLAILSITVVLARSKRLQAIQARQLAARIGLVRGNPGGWSSG